MTHYLDSMGPCEVMITICVVGMGFLAVMSLIHTSMILRAERELDELRSRLKTLEAKEVRARTYKL